MAGSEGPIAVEKKSGTKAYFSPSFFGFSLLILIHPLLHTSVSPSPAVFDNPDQAE
jgi:hypothetical protein